MSTFSTNVYINCTADRVGSGPSQDMRLDPETNLPVVLAHVNSAKSLGYNPVVLSRADKDDLNEYLDAQGIQYQISITSTFNRVIGQIKEFADVNIIVEPDIRFSPPSAMSDAATIIHKFGRSLVVGTGSVPDPVNWKILAKNDATSSGPKMDGPGMAIGFVCFGKNRKVGLMAFNKTKKVWSLKRFGHVILQGLRRT